MVAGFADLRTSPPNQLRWPRKPVGRAEHADSHNHRREPQGEALSAVWSVGWDVCYHILGMGGFVHLFNLQAVADLTVGAVEGWTIRATIVESDLKSLYVVYYSPFCPAKRYAIDGRVGARNRTALQRIAGPCHRILFFDNQLNHAYFFLPFWHQSAQ